MGSTGVILEARAQRLFLSQGSFAERRLWPSATLDRRMLATDIDVLISEYASGFHLTRRHIECKSGQISLLDRILWLNGVRTLLGADSSYLIGQDIDVEASAFAKKLDVQLVTLKRLDTWETSLGIEQEMWPCRSHISYEAARAHWGQCSKDGIADENWKFIRSALAFIEVDGWLNFEYRHLNRLLRLLDECSRRYEKIKNNRDQELCSRYVFSALLVRFTQYLLAICLDLETILPTDIKGYLINRLTFGNQDPSHISELMHGTIDWVKQGLNAKGITDIPPMDLERFYAPPSYAEEMVELVEKLLQQNNDSRFLVVSMEVSQFGVLDVVNKFPLLKSASATGDGLTAFVKGFVVRTFSTPTRLVEPLTRDVIASYSWPPSNKAKGTGTITQLSINAEAEPIHKKNG